MEEDKYVKLTDVQNILDLIQEREKFHDWTKEFDDYDKKVKIAIETLRYSVINL